tara:strand:- start:558 stop:746 length:189 start_codon:yes stop_codon:yes gene_type:complete
MASTELLNTVELTINEAIKRSKLLDYLDRKALQQEYREWIEATNSKDKKYDILYIKQLNSNF